MQTFTKPDGGSDDFDKTLRALLAARREVSQDVADAPALAAFGLAALRKPYDADRTPHV